MSFQKVWTVLGAMLIIGTSVIACADSILGVTLNTTPLTVAPGSSSGPFSIFFQMTDGSGLNDGNNTVTLTNFMFGSGSPAGGATLSGGAAGGLGSGVTLTDSSFFTSFSQGFTPGTTLSFQLQMTTNVDAGGTPDAFAFSILNSMGVPIPTADPTLADTFLTINIDSQNPTALAYGTDSSRTGIAISAPSVSLQAPVPEPATLVMFGGTVLAGALWHLGRHRLRKSAV